MAKEYDNNDSGVLSRSDDRKSSNSPTHSGRIQLSKDTLKALNAMYKDGEDPIIYLKGWTTKKQGLLSLRIEAPLKYREEIGASDVPRDDRRAAQSRGRASSPPRRDRDRDRGLDDDDFNDDAPF